jgi:hypothetical protein
MHRLDPKLHMPPQPVVVKLGKAVIKKRKVLQKNRLSMTCLLQENLMPVCSMMPWWPSNDFTSKKLSKTL